jgi:hypothetical protein
MRMCGQALVLVSSTLSACDPAVVTFGRTDNQGLLVALKDNDTVTVIAGPQGGHHVLVGVRGEHLLPEAVLTYDIVSASAALLTKPFSIQLEAATVYVDLADPDGKTWERTNDLLVLEEPITEVVGRTATLRASLTTQPEADTFQDEFTVTVVAGTSVPNALEGG